MALSRVSGLIKQQYQEVKLPISGLTVKFRPYTVQEQKLIVQAKAQAKTEAQSILAAIGILQECVDGVKLKDLHMFDFQTLFFSIRNSSEGADISFKLTCENEKCKAKFSSVLNIKNDLTIVNMENTKKQIKVEGTTIAIDMELPSVTDALLAQEGPGSNEEKSFALIPKCIKKLYNGEEVISDLTDAEKTELFDQLDSNTFTEITKFFQNGPAYMAKNPVTCEYCGHQHILTKEEVAGFFT